MIIHPQAKWPLIISFWLQCPEVQSLPGFQALTPISGITHHLWQHLHSGKKYSSLLHDDVPKFDPPKHAGVPTTKKHILLFSWATQLLKVFLYLWLIGKQQPVIPGPGASPGSSCNDSNLPFWLLLLRHHTLSITRIHLYSLYPLPNSVQSWGMSDLCCRHLFLTGFSSLIHFIPEYSVTL